MVVRLPAHVCAYWMSIRITKKTRSHWTYHQTLYRHFWHISSDMCVKYEQCSHKDICSYCLLVSILFDISETSYKALFYLNLTNIYVCFLKKKVVLSENKPLTLSCCYMSLCYVQFCQMLLYQYDLQTFLSSKKRIRKLFEWEEHTWGSRVTFHLNKRVHFLKTVCCHVMARRSMLN